MTSMRLSKIATTFAIIFLKALSGQPAVAATATLGQAIADLPIFVPCHMIGASPKNSFPVELRFYDLSNQDYTPGEKIYVMPIESEGALLGYTYYRAIHRFDNYDPTYHKDVLPANDRRRPSLTSPYLVTQQVMEWDRTREEKFVGWELCVLSKEMDSVNETFINPSQLDGYSCDNKIGLVQAEFMFKARLRDPKCQSNRTLLCLNTNVADPGGGTTWRCEMAGSNEPFECSGAAGPNEILGIPAACRDQSVAKYGDDYLQARPRTIRSAPSFGPEASPDQFGNAEVNSNDVGRAEVARIRSDKMKQAFNGLSMALSSIAIPLSFISPSAGAMVGASASACSIMACTFDHSLRCWLEAFAMGGAEVAGVMAVANSYRATRFATTAGRAAATVGFIAGSGAAAANFSEGDLVRGLGNVLGAGVSLGMLKFFDGKISYTPVKTDNRVTPCKICRAGSAVGEGMSCSASSSAMRNFAEYTETTSTFKSAAGGSLVAATAGQTAADATIDKTYSSLRAFFGEDAIFKDGRSILFAKNRIDPELHSVVDDVAAAIRTNGTPANVLSQATSASHLKTTMEESLAGAWKNYEGWGHGQLYIPPGQSRSLLPISKPDAVGACQDTVSRVLYRSSDGKVRIALSYVGKPSEGNLIRREVLEIVENPSRGTTYLRGFGQNFRNGQWVPIDAGERVSCLTCHAINSAQYLLKPGANGAPAIRAFTQGGDPFFQH